MKSSLRVIEKPSKAYLNYSGCNNRRCFSEVSNFAKMINDNDGFDQTYEIFRIAQSVVDHPEAVRLATRRLVIKY